MKNNNYCEEAGSVVDVGSTTLKNKTPNVKKNSGTNPLKSEEIPSVRIICANALKIFFFPISIQEDFELLLLQ